MSKTFKNIAILGSTGSIGQQTLDIVKTFPDKFKIVGLSGGKNTALLASQIAELKPELVFSNNSIDLPHDIKLCTMDEIAAHPNIDLIVIATSGKAGLTPTLAAIKAGKKIALANKEVLVMAGEIIMSEAKKYGAEILPVDSEHSAIWQCLQGDETATSRIFLTASGGPFYQYDLSQLAEITVEEALHHPTWKMGRKVTIDSATLMNKGLEAIEAHWLFSIAFDKIEIIIHPQSIVHALVEFTDGSTKALLSVPDMHLPIQYALSYPDRLPNSNFSSLNITQINSLVFEAVDYNNFPCLSLALEAGKNGGTYPSVLCAADEIAVELFLNKNIHFTEIAVIIEQILNAHHGILSPTLDEILTADAWARNTATQIAKKRYICY